MYNDIFCIIMIGKKIISNFTDYFDRLLLVYSKNYFVYKYSGYRNMICLFTKYKFKKKIKYINIKIYKIYKI